MMISTKICKKLKPRANLAEQKIAYKLAQSSSIFEPVK